MHSTRRLIPIYRFTFFHRFFLASLSDESSGLSPLIALIVVVVFHAQCIVASFILPSGVASKGFFPMLHTATVRKTPTVRKGDPLCTRSCPR